MNARAAELGKVWRGYVEQQNEFEDLSHLYESTDKIALKKAIRRLEENKKQAREAKREAA